MHSIICGRIDVQIQGKEDTMIDVKKMINYLFGMRFPELDNTEITKEDTVYSRAYIERLKIFTKNQHNNNLLLLIGCGSIIMLLFIFIGTQPKYGPLFFFDSCFFGIIFYCLCQRYSQTKQMEEQLKLFESILYTMDTKQSYPIRDLAAKAYTERNLTVQKIQDMIDHRWFLQGHLIKDKDLFCLTDHAYFMNTDQTDKSDEETKDTIEKIQALRQYDLLVDTGNDYLDKIKESSEGIREQEVKECILETEEQIDKLNSYFAKNKNNLSILKRMVNYYLPTTLTIIKRYIQSYEYNDSKEVKKNREDMHNAFIDLKDAYTQMYNHLFEEDVVDVNADLAVLQTMLIKDGYKTKE